MLYSGNSKYLAVAALACALIFTARAPLRAQDALEDLEDRISAELQAGRIDDAIDTARLAVGQYPKSSQLYQYLGTALFKKGVNEDARTAFRRAIELDPTLPQNYYDLALVELSGKQYAQAVTPLEAYLHLDPQNAQAHLLLGRAYHNLNRTFPAIEQFKKALALNSELPLAHYHLGYAYQSLGKLDDALAEFKQEIAFNPRFATVDAMCMTPRPDPTMPASSIHTFVSISSARAPA